MAMSWSYLCRCYRWLYSHQISLFAMLSWYHFFAVQEIPTNGLCAVYALCSKTQRLRLGFLDQWKHCVSTNLKINNRNNEKLMEHTTDFLTCNICCFFLFKCSCKAIDVFVIWVNNCFFGLFMAVNDSHTQHS